MVNGTSNPSLDATSDQDVPLGFWVGHWQGKRRLLTAFWLIGVVGLILLSLIQTLVMAIGLMLHYFDKVGATILAPIIYGPHALWLIYAIYASVAIWRCAVNTSWRGWGYLARALVMLVLLGILLPGLS